MIRRLAHLCFDTDNLAAMADFYSKTFGLPLKFAFKNAQGQIFGYYIDCGDSTFIEIFDRVLKQKHWGGTLREFQPSGRFGHFCLEVTGLADLKLSLEKKGLKVTEIKTGMDRSMQAWTSDPDGNAVELMEYTANSLQVQRTAASVLPVAQ